MASSCPATAHPLEDEDMLSLILQQTGIHFDYDTLDGSPDRNKIRLLHRTAARLADGMCNSYKDARRAGEAMLRIDPAEVAERASHALHKLMPRRMVLEGLDDDGLASVLAAAAKSSLASGNPSQGLEVLWLQRGEFSGACLYTCHPKLADHAATLVDVCDDNVPSQTQAAAPVVTSPVSVLAAAPPMLSTGSAALVVLPPSLPPSPPKGRLLPRLVELDLGGCGQLTDAGLEALCASAPILARLRVTVNARLQRPRLTCPWLRSATLAICANLQDEAVASLCRGAPLLRELNLWRCSSLVAPGFRLPYLETLNLCECVDLTDGALASVTACSRLSSLLLAGCDSLAGSHRFGGGRSLTALDVSDIAATTDAQLTAACADSPDLRRLDLSRSGPGVRSPSLGGTHLQAIIATRCEHLGDDAVTLACGSAPALQTLMLALCTSLHSPRILGERLSELNLSGCSALQDAAVTFACQNAPTLRRLSLSLCAALVAPRVVGPCLQRVELSHCEALSLPLIGGLAMVELSLSGCSRLEDAALDGLCDRAPALRKLSISGCTKLKDTRLRAPALMVLNCHGVARSVVDTAADRLQCPQLHKLVSDTYVDAVDAGFEEVD